MIVVPDSEIKENKKAQKKKSEAQESTVKSDKNIKDVISTLDDIVKTLKEKKGSEGVPEAISELSKAIKEKKDNSADILIQLKSLISTLQKQKVDVAIKDTRNQIKFPEQLNTELGSDSKDLLNSVIEEIRILIESMNNKPDSFRFDVKRNQLGYIDHVLVKPIK